MLLRHCLTKTGKNDQRVENDSVHRNNASLSACTRAGKSRFFRFLVSKSYLKTQNLEKSKI